MQNNNELTAKICNRLSDYILDSQLSNTNVIQIIEHLGQYLNLKTRSEYAKKHQVSYNAAKKYRENVKIFGCKLVVDNE